MQQQPTRSEVASAPILATGSRIDVPPGHADARPGHADTTPGHPDAQPGPGISGPGPGDQRRRVTRPLPDPTAIQLCPIPLSAPPYDTVAAGTAGDPGVVPAGRPGPGRLAGAMASAAPGAGGGRKPGTRPAAGPGPAAEWPSRFAQVLAETLAGERPPAQLTPWTTERARSQIRRLGPLLTAQQRPVIKRIVTSLPTAGVMEMSVIVGLGQRVRGLAVRLEQADAPPDAPGPAGKEGRWLCTAIEAA